MTGVFNHCSRMVLQPVRPPSYADIVEKSDAQGRSYKTAPQLQRHSPQLEVKPERNGVADERRSQNEFPI